jgi:hypothetical protein
MAYFAEIDGNGVVQRVIVADQAFIDSGKVGDPNNWIETSDDGQIRKNYAGVGYVYDVERDAFIEPKPAPSWMLDEASAKWIPPVEQPKDGKDYKWEESTLEWVDPKL